MKTIFVAFPALDDHEIFATIEDAFKKAKNPERVFLGIAPLYSSRRYLRDVKKFTKEFGKQIRLSELRVTSTNIFKTLGVGKGRRAAANLYAGEDYVLQIDSHTWFAQDWDTKLIDLHKQAVKELGLTKVLLTGYAGHYAYSSESIREPYTDGGKLRYPFISEEQRFSDIIPNWFDVPLPDDFLTPFVPSVKFNANFSFGDKNFGKYNGLLDEAVFFDEELTQTINLTAAGFNLVFPNVKEPLICHLYSDHFNEFSGARPALPDYMSPLLGIVFHKKTNDNFTTFVKDPKNQPAIKKWEKYAKCSLTFGPLRAGHIPEYYINQPDSDLKL